MSEFETNTLNTTIDSASKQLNDEFIGDIVNIINKYDNTYAERTDTPVVNDDVIKNINDYIQNNKIEESKIDITPLFNELDNAMVKLYKNAVAKSLEISKKFPSSEGGSKSGQKGGSPRGLSPRRLSPTGLSHRGKIAMILFLGAGIGGCLFAIADLSKKISNMSSVADQRQGTNIMVMCVPIICVIFLSCMIWGLLNQMCERGADSATIYISRDVEDPPIYNTERDNEIVRSTMVQLRHMYQNQQLYGGIQEILNNIESVKGSLLASVENPDVMLNLAEQIQYAIRKFNELLQAEESPPGESPPGESHSDSEPSIDDNYSTDSNDPTLPRAALPDNNNNPQHVFPCFQDITDRDTFLRLIRLSPNSTQLLEKRVEELDNQPPSGGMRMNRRKRNMKTRMRSRKTQKGQPARNRRTQKPQPVRRRRTHRRKHRRTRK
jgi:hypothetical protein